MYMKSPQSGTKRVVSYSNFYTTLEDYYYYYYFVFPFKLKCFVFIFNFFKMNFQNRKSFISKIEKDTRGNSSLFIYVLLIYLTSVRDVNLEYQIWIRN